MKHCKAAARVLRPLPAGHWAALSLLFACAPLVASCRKSGGSSAPSTASLSGSLGVAPVSGSGGTVFEQEPNDSTTQAQFIGSLEPGSLYTIRGNITDDGSDPFDGFRFVSAAPIEVRFELAFENLAADLDLFVYDVAQDDVVLVFESGDNPEVGDFTVSMAGVEFDLVVYSFIGTSDYELRVEALAPGAAPPAHASLPFAARAAPSRKSPDAAAAWVGATHPMWPGRLVALEDEEAAASVERAVFLEREGLELVSRGPCGSSTYRVRPNVAATLRAGAPGFFQDSLEHHVARAALRLSRASGVRAASPDYVLRHFGEPSDTHYPLQWHYPQIKMPLAWSVETGSSGVLVAVIDTGHAHHPDLLPRIVGGYDFISDPAVSGDGDGMDPDATDPGDGQGPIPSSFHGTHVSGTVGAVSDNQLGVAGMDWGCGILSLRALGIGGGSLADIAAAIRYAARLPNASGQLPATKADVVNMSLGTTAFSSVLQAACNDALAAGVVLVAAAGNQPDSQLKYPAAFASVIAVGAVRYDKQLAPYSTFGSWIDVVAPGGDLNVDQNGDGFPDGVLSTLANDQGQLFYGFQQGTSMAAPHVAGLAALLKSSDPTLTPAQVRSILRTTAEDLGPPGPDSTFGHGLIDAHKALLAVTGGTATDPLLFAHPTTIDFGLTSQMISVSLANAGADTIVVLGASVEYAAGSGTGWLETQLVAAPPGAGISHSSLALTVNRSGLSDGDHFAAVVIDTDVLPDLRIDVKLTAGSGGLPDYTVFVLLVELDTLATARQAVTSLAAGYSWSMSGVAAGSYLLVAGTDENDDGFIGDEGEPLFGIWPSAVEPEVLELPEGANLEDVDFPVGQGSIGTLGAGSSLRFRRQ